MSTRMERRWERQTKKRRSALRFTAELLAVIVLAALVRAFVFSITEVDGPSMQDTLYSGQIVAVEKLTCRFGGVQQRADRDLPLSVVSRFLHQARHRAGGTIRWRFGTA